MLNLELCLHHKDGNCGIWFPSLLHFLQTSLFLSLFITVCITSIVHTIPVTSNNATLITCAYFSGKCETENVILKRDDDNAAKWWGTPVAKDGALWRRACVVTSKGTMGWQDQLPHPPEHPPSLRTAGWGSRSRQGPGSSSGLSYAIRQWYSESEWCGEAQKGSGRWTGKGASRHLAWCWAMSDFSVIDCYSCEWPLSCFLNTIWMSE